MNVTQVLEGTISPDAQTRQKAEQQLNSAAENDFSGYLTTLAQALASEQAPNTVRIAAGLALKNSFSAREYTRLRASQQKWIQQVSQDVKKNVKELALQTLKSKDSRAGQSAGQFVASIAAIELPRGEWPELLNALVDNVGGGEDQLKQASLVTIGFICETEDAKLREALHAYSNPILTAIVQGARKEEPNLEVRNAAMTALSDCLEFVRQNFENEGERNYIMQVVCEATQSGDSRIEAGAFGCLNRIMGLYYDKMKFYMEKALYGLTIVGMKNQEEDVAKLAVEFWCTVCEEEIAIDDDNSLVAVEEDGPTHPRPHYRFANVASPEVVPTLLQLMCSQDEDATDEDYNLARAAYQCLSLFAQAIGDKIIALVFGFVEQFFQDNDWRKRDAAVSAFGAILEGPSENNLIPHVKTAMPMLLGKMTDPNMQVRDSTAYTIGRICDIIPEAIDASTQLSQLIEVLFAGLTTNPKMAASCCWALMNLADKFAGEPGCQTNSLSPHFDGCITALLAVTEKPDTDGVLRTAAYEVINTFVTDAANDSLQTVAKLSEVILQRLESTIDMQTQVVSVEDRLTLEEIQTSLASCILAVINRLEAEIAPQADRIMHVMLRILSSVGAKSSVPDTLFATVGALASSIGQDFNKYMGQFAPMLYNALANQEEPALCSMAIGLVSDVARALEEKAQPYCDNFMNHLLTNLRSQSLSNQFKPAILQCFGDIAHAIGPAFESYLQVVAQVLQHAANVFVSGESQLDMYEYVVSLREGIMDAWSGVIYAMRSKPQVLSTYVDPIFQLIVHIANDQTRSEGLLRSTMGVLGDLATVYKDGEYAHYFRQDTIHLLIRETRRNKDYQLSTKETAEWARAEVKRQSSMFNTIQS